jgi:hypothetical protein
MRKIIRSLQITVVSFSIVVAAAGQSDWKGSYNFTEQGGKNAAGVAVIISHELEIFEGGDGLAARLDSNGFQSSAELVCTTKIDGAKLLIVFQSYGESNMFEPYEQGDLLMTLERKTEKGKQVIVTHWGKFTPAIPKNEKSGKIYFEKVNTN